MPKIFLFICKQIFTEHLLLHARHYPRPCNVQSLHSNGGVGNAPPPSKQEMNEQDNPKVVVYEESKTVMSSENELCRVVVREVLSDYLTS